MPSCRGRACSGLIFTENEKLIVMIEYCLNADCPIDELFEDDILYCPHLTCSGCAACPFYLCEDCDVHA